MPKQIDVVIATFNRLWALQRSVGFYLSLPEVGQVIVVNDGSTDGTREWLEQKTEDEKRVVCINHEKNRGACASRNDGANAALADLVLFSDDDMIITPPDGLALMAELLVSVSGDVLAPAQIIPESGLSKPLPVVGEREHDGMVQLYRRQTLELVPRSALARKALPAIFPAHLTSPVMLMRREVLSRVCYDEGLGITSYRDETDFQLKALSEGFKLYACSRPVIVDFDRQTDSGGCHSVSLVEYELRACRNNWRILRRHRKTIHDELGIKTPILIMQAAFLGEHMLRKLGRQLAGRVLRRLGVLPGRA